MFFALPSSLANLALDFRLVDGPRVKKLRKIKTTRQTFLLNKKSLFRICTKFIQETGNLEGVTESENDWIWKTENLESLVERDEGRKK